MSFLIILTEGMGNTANSSHRCSETAESESDSPDSDGDSSDNDEEESDEDESGVPFIDPESITEESVYAAAGIKQSDVVSWKPNPDGSAPLELVAEVRDGFK